MKGDNDVNAYRKVLIAISESKDVLIQGLRLIGPEKCGVTVMRVNPPYEGDLSLTGVKNIGQVLDGEADKAITEIEEVAKSEGISVKVRIEVGDIEKKIVEVAEDEKSDLIIMGSGSRSSIKKLLLGKLKSEPLVSALQYCSVYDPDTLDELEKIDKKALLAVALTVGKTRLIDNMIVTPGK